MNQKVVLHPRMYRQKGMAEVKRKSKRRDCVKVRGNVDRTSIESIKLKDVRRLGTKKKGKKKWLLG